MTVIRIDTHTHTVARSHAFSTISENAASAAEVYGQTLEEFLSQSMGKTLEEFEEETSDYALKAAKVSLVLQEISDAEGLSVTDVELQKGIDDYVELYNYPSKTDFINSIDINEFKEYILESKVQEFLADNAVISVDSD